MSNFTPGRNPRDEADRNAIDHTNPLQLDDNVDSLLSRYELAREFPPAAIQKPDDISNSKT